MITEQRAVFGLRVFLVVMFGVLLLLQVMSLPGQFRHMAEESPESAYLRWPLTLVSLFWVLCVQVVIVSTWKLLTLVKNDEIFSAASVIWVNAIVWAIAAAWVVFLGLFLYFGFFVADDPGVLILMFLLLVGVAVIGLLMVVMRALLLRATALRTDLETVI
nr:DUF2975 domain-containing protein [uncultured Friedmanniella sp.]